jgi:TRAP transporter TAXI family solute receptor
MTTFADIIGKKLGDVEIRIRAEGAATRHAIDAARGETDFFLTSPIIQELMLSRKGMYEKVKGAPEMAQKLRSILMFDIGLYHITVYEESGIRTMMDIKGKKVFLGPPGGAALRVAKIFTKAATGYEPGKDFDVVKLGWEAAAAAFSDKRIDVYISPTIAPSPIIQKIAETNRIRFLTLEDTVFETEAAKALFRRPGRTRGFIDVGTYGKNQMNTEPVQSTGAIVGIATREGMPDDIIYRMTKAFWEGVREMRNSAPWLRSIDRSRALDFANVPLHPGALKYYREIGLIVPPQLVPE